MASLSSSSLFSTGDAEKSRLADCKKLKPFIAIGLQSIAFSPKVTTFPVSKVLGFLGMWGVVWPTRIDGPDLIEEAADLEILFPPTHTTQ